MYVCWLPYVQILQGLSAIYDFAGSGMHIVKGGEMAAVRERFTFSLRSASNDHYTKRKESSSPTLPTISDICCEIRNSLLQLHGNGIAAKVKKCPGVR